MSLSALQYDSEFVDRHIGPDADEITRMLEALQLDSLESLVEKTVPRSIALESALQLPDPMTEEQALNKLKAMGQRNANNRSFIGLGYYDTRIPNVILRNVLENPGWYTAYTPYQPEISQGRLECLLNFQQMVLDFTAMDLANASLLDEATAAAEAMSLAKRVSKNRSANRFFVHENCFPQTVDVLKTRAERFGFELVTGSLEDLQYEEVFGALFQYPDVNGAITDFSDVFAKL
ncbi:MAG: glycine dehydrogenase (aminomethyl-transferring), partial [Pseudomonadales bacterium]|nr:glycine dehydrogenase (aminomethyl-transferring) [Pseudomonadales bacterium]